MKENSGDVKQKILCTIKNNYFCMEESIVDQLRMTQELHGATIGSVREDIWEQLFEMIIPKKFVIEHSAFIIDSDANYSGEVDLVIMDSTYTPYIFRNGRLKFIPIEAVAAVVECKSSDYEGIEGWAERIKQLRTSQNSIARLANDISTGPAPAQNSTRPIRILCAVPGGKKVPPKDRAMFDCVLEANVESKKIEISWNPEIESLSDCFLELNFHGMREKGIRFAEKIKEEIKLDQYGVYDKEDNQLSLLSFNFQLNQLLMLINNPMLFPHRAYVNMFREEGKDDEKPGGGH